MSNRGPGSATAISVRPLSGTFGARIEGIDLSGELDDATMARLREEFLRHHVLLFPGQGPIRPEHQVAFAARWGELHRMAPGIHVERYPEILELNTKGNKPATDRWHSDMSMAECPPMATMLLGRVIPVGGDTIFASQYQAYDELSEGMKHMLAGLRALHCGDNFAKDSGYDPDTLPRNLHPVIRTHPETGRKALYVSLEYTRNFENMTVEESEPLLKWLAAYCVQPNFTIRHQWTAGDLLMWDNRCLQHYAVADYGSAPRIMHRITILGDRPV